MKSKTKKHPLYCKCGGLIRLTGKTNKKTGKLTTTYKCSKCGKIY